ncbi:bifunctional [glutamate--ammonia ligase]-adenylyl-L-tyrosine phosphorylase/[glutamate--ammonia-ligase] adenylyltransferase [Methylomonas sp. HYX-M1]|uniref:bifunctional [glutamate--ammonia ligase]-adenylyl-L-tyrosine phosphorylase/[glutamate--ammonia-ligase] adenylyltransferase n=1 Tax=Methylomonas sp. HYX-M1 TaxID=3139307 RepID=UPI00345BE063
MPQNTVLPIPADLPATLREHAEPLYAKLAATLSAADLDICRDERIKQSAPKVCLCSQFVLENWLKEPAIIKDLVESGDLFSPVRRQSYASTTAQFEVDSEAALAKRLRQFRRREMLRIAWRDLAGWADLDETLADLSELADCCIRSGLDFCYAQACQRWGTPISRAGHPLNIVVLGMGKLGAAELNFSSDIDLIFGFAEDGLLTERKEISYGEFFTRICRSLIKLLDETTVDGFVFRTDVRLRPFGDSGPLLMDFDGMEKYYLSQAREWERYAMIKARQVAGDFVTGQQLAGIIKPFVYRRYLDYGAFEELRALKFQITQELKRKDRLDNVKLGPGGIREIEFIGQAFQLIRGGREPRLQQREIQAVLKSLAELQLMTHNDVSLLTEAYRFLRQVENHIQAFQDKQTHDLPKQEAYQMILAYSLGYNDWPSFKARLDSVRQGVHGIFEQVFSLSEQDRQHQSSKVIWSGVDPVRCLALLGECGYIDAEDTFKALQDFKTSSAVKKLTNKGANFLDRLMPLALETIANIETREVTLKRVLALFSAVSGRSVYLALLAENPDALNQLVRLASASSWICDYLGKYPILFDELLDPAALYQPLNKAALAQDLQRELDKLESRDSEALMIALRQFKHINVLRVAAADVMSVIPVMVVSDYLTWIAEVVLDQVVMRAWSMSIDKYGCPPGASAQQISGFGVIGFGKLGGIELGYASDLDLVFLYRCQDDLAMTDGPKSISCAQFYIQLGQKIRHILDTKMLSGILYECDLRLRPNGDSGLLVTHIDHYEDYLRNQAWTWEHQALVRARFISGDVNMQEEYQSIRARILALPRDTRQLKQQVAEMREKMRTHLADESADAFDLKQSKGGMADIEFLVQFGVLARAQHNAKLTIYTDNIRILESLTQDGFLNSDDAHALKEAYKAYRNFAHHQILQGERAVASPQEFDKLRGKVDAIWEHIMLNRTT